jgi:nucleoside 2-deoxyribosyltransferase
VNIYFACSITGGRKYESTYQRITSFLLQAGHVVPTAHLADPQVKDLEEVVKAGDVFKRDTAWIRACDALIAEVSTPSHGVGYEIAYALTLQKPVLCLHQEGLSISKMLSGNPHSMLRVHGYRQAEDIPSIIQSFIRKMEVS